VVVRCEPDWEQFAGAGWADTILTTTVTDRFHAKQGRSIGRWTLSRGDRTLVVYLKRHYVLPRVRGLLAALVPGRSWSPALEEWDHLEWARAHGFPVPRAMAGGELLGSWGRLQSFLAVEELPGMLPLHEAIPLALRWLPATEFAAWKAGLTAELARLCRELHRRRAFHQDLYLCHFYLPEADCGAVPERWPGRVWMIDFHRLAFHRLGWPWWQAKDLGQLLYSTFDVEGVEEADRDRFWDRYRTGDWGEATPPPRWIGTAARWRAGRNRRHNERRAAR
jgi:heptose I phosphotransferase